MRQTGASVNSELISFIPSIMQELETIAKSMERRYGRRVSECELLDAGRDSLLNSLRVFDASKGIRFEKFAAWKGRNAMLDLVRKTMRSRILNGYEGCADSVYEAETYCSVEDEFIRVEILQAIEVASCTLESVQMAILERHYYDGETFDEIGISMGKTKSWASRHHAAGMNTLRKELRVR